MENKLGRIVRLYYGFQIFFPLLIWVPVFYEYQIRCGLEPKQIFDIQTFYYFLFFAAEVPTGVLADRWGRKKVLTLSALFSALGNVSAVLWTSVGGFMLHFTLIAISRSLSSGAASSYLYEALDENGQRDRYLDHEGRAYAAGLFVKVFAWAIAGWMMEQRLALPYELTFLGALVAFACAAALPHQVITKQGRFHWNFVEAFKILRAHISLLALMFQGAGIFVVARVIQVNLYQPILKWKGFDLVALGWVMSLMTLIEAAGSLLPRKLLRSGLDVRRLIIAVWIFTVGVGISMSGLSVSSQSGTLAAYFAFSLFVGLAYPTQKTLINEAISSAGGRPIRATLLSVEAMIARLLTTGVAALSASAVARGRIPEFLAWGGMVLLLYVTLFSGFGLGLSRQKRHVH